MTDVPVALEPGAIAEDQIEQAVAWMNSQHALVFDGSKTLVWTKQFNLALQRQEWRQSGITDFRAFYAPYLILDGNKRPRTLAEVWLSHPDSKRFRDVVFDPTGACPSNVLNLWRGWTVKPKQGSWKCLQEHIYEGIAQANAARYDYVVGWLAQMVQQPLQPAGTAIVLRGDPGAGKGMLARMVGRVMGEHFVHISNSGQLTNRFNGFLANTMFVFADEAVWAGDRQGQATLKALVTEPTLAIERKGREIITMRNCVHLMMASNDDWVAPVGTKDRRYCVLDVAPKREEGYYSPVYKEQANGGASAMLFDLLAHDLSTFKPRTIPHTTAREDQMLNSMTPDMKWWHDCLTTGEIDGDVWPERVDRQKLYKNYIDTVMNKWRGSHPASQAKLGRQLSMMIPGLDSVKSTWSRRFYLFPPLHECRKAFERYIGCDLTWPADEQPSA